ncbi:MAG TPA: hypothetical protein VGF23_20075 [Gaiellaceae bacterium]|jgi:hypothetical protein
MADKRGAVMEELQELRQDLRDLVVTITTDQKELARRHRQWQMLQAATGALFMVAARRLATKAWFVLTGEVPPNQIPSKAPSKKSKPAS